MCAAMGFTDASRAYEMDDGRRLVLPLLRRSVGPVRLSEGSNPLHCGVGGLLAPDGRARTRSPPSCAISPAAGCSCARSGPSPCTPTGGPPPRPDRAVVVDRRAHLLDLEPGWDALWAKGFARSAGAGCVPPNGAGSRSRAAARGELLAEFYGLLELATARWARMQHEPRWLTMARLRGRDPLRKFQAAARSLGERFRVSVARWTGGRWRGWSCSRAATPTTSAARWTRHARLPPQRPAPRPRHRGRLRGRVRRLLHGRLRLVPVGGGVQGAVRRPAGALPGVPLRAAAALPHRAGGQAWSKGDRVPRISEIPWPSAATRDENRSGSAELVVAWCA